METCINSTMSSAPPMPPLSPAANGKPASGISNTLTEANVWETRDFTPELRWGNDSMHARYYSPYLARFVSVDPVGGSVGSSQSWNRYSYVLNNPVNLVDPTGLNAETTCDGNNNCVTQVRADIVRDPNDPDQVAAADAFQQGGEAYWNNLTATGQSGETITFDVQFTQVDPGNANPNTDTLNVVSGAGVSNVSMRMAPAGQVNPPDTGQIFTQDTTNNPSGMAGVAAHETGHLLGLRDLYVPGQAVPNVPGAQGEIMLNAQPGNQAGTAWQVLVPSQNFNAIVIRP